MKDKTEDSNNDDIEQWVHFVNSERERVDHDLIKVVQENGERKIFIEDFYFILDI